MSCRVTLFLTIFIVVISSLSQAKYHQITQQPIPELLHSNQFLNAVEQWRDYLAQSQDSRTKWSFEVVLAGVFCFIAAMISSAGGIGGGGLFLPILTIVAGLSLKTASSFSAFMIVGVSIASVVHNLSGGKALIDYDVVILSQPCLLLGVSFGVICNVMFPEWLATGIFAVFLTWSTLKTCRKGVFYWKEENQQVRLRNHYAKLENGSTDQDQDDQVISSLTEPILTDENENKCNQQQQQGLPWHKLVVLSIVWMLFSMLYLLQGSQSLTHLKPCGVGYWLLSALQIPLAFIFTASILLKRRNQSLYLDQGEGAAVSGSSASSMVLFPILAFLAGSLGGLYGIGGGMLISPLLLQIGMSPKVTAATCSFMVFFSSTMSAFQYLVLGMDDVSAALVLSAVCFVASVLGLVVVQRAIREYGRASLIVFSLGTVMALSTVLIATFGAFDVLRDYTAGKPMGFFLPC